MVGGAVHDHERGHDQVLLFRPVGVDPAGRGPPAGALSGPPAGGSGRQEPGNHRRRRARPSKPTSSPGAPAPTTAATSTGWSPCSPTTSGCGRRQCRWSIRAASWPPGSWPRCPSGRAAPTGWSRPRANGQPAFGAYVRDPRAGVLNAIGLLVCTLAGERICTMTLFDKSVLARFGLPRTLPN